MKTLEMSNGAGGSDEGKKRCEEMVKCRSYEIILGMMGLVFTLVAAVVAGTNKDTESVPISLVDGLSPLHLTLTAKWSYMSSTVYFVALNAVVCAYAAISMVFIGITGKSRRRNSKGSVLVVALDLTMLALLFSANGVGSSWSHCSEFKFSHSVAQSLLCFQEILHPRGSCSCYVYAWFILLYLPCVALHFQSSQNYFELLTPLSVYVER